MIVYQIIKKFVQFFFMIKIYFFCSQLSRIEQDLEKEWQEKLERQQTQHERLLTSKGKELEQLKTLFNNNETKVNQTIFLFINSSSSSSYNKLLQNQMNQNNKLNFMKNE